MVDGLICDNNDEALYKMVERVVLGEVDIIAMKKRLLETDYSNKEEIEKVYNLLLPYDS